MIVFGIVRPVQFATHSMVSPQSLPADFTPGPGLLRGRNLLVTGAHTDLGHAVTTALASHGASLMLCTRKERLLADLYDALVAENYPEPLLVAMDLDRAEEENFSQLASSLEEEVGTLHGIVHMDLPAAPLSPVTLSKLETWETCLTQVLRQPMLLVRSMIPLLQAADNPSVVLYTLPCGRRGKAYWGPLGCALSAVENLCQILAEEHPEIRFNTLDIGPVDSDLRRRFYPAESRSGLKSVHDPAVINGFLHLVSGVGESQSGKAFRLA